MPTKSTRVGSSWRAHGTTQCCVCCVFWLRACNILFIFGQLDAQLHVLLAMTSHKSARICLNFVKYGCGLLSFHVIWVLALPAEEISSPRTSSKTGKNEKPFELKDVTSQDEDIQ